MKGRFGAIFSIFLIFSGNFCPLLASEVKNDELENNISIDYLKTDNNEDYILGPGDKLQLVVSREYPELTTNINIDSEGTIFIPKLNKIYVKGLTIVETINLLNKAYKKFINYPDVEIHILKYKPIRILTKGEFNNPGIIIMEGAETLKNDAVENPIREEMLLKTDLRNVYNETKNLNSFFFPTVFDAIRASGGITEYSDLENVEIIRNQSISRGGGQKKATLNFKKLMKFGDTSQNIRVHDGDIITINRSKNQNLQQLSEAISSNLNPKFINVYVTGRVKDPGEKLIPRSSSLNDALDISGGVRILKGKVRFIRFNKDGTFDKRKISYRQRNKRGSYNNPILSNGDLVYVENGIFANSNEVISEVTAPFAGLFSAYGLIKILSE